MGPSPIGFLANP